MSRLLEKYNKEIRKELQKQFNYANVHQIPKIIKVSINMGIGSDGVSDSKSVQASSDELTLIAGQKTVITKAKKSIASFKLRDGVAIGTKVTLRRNKMYEFIDRLSSIALPRLRDFRGLNAKSFDGNGNFTLGLKEHIIFPEVEYDRVSKVRGMDITFVTTAKTAEEGQALLSGFNLPFKK